MTGPGEMVEAAQAAIRARDVLDRLLEGCQIVDRDYRYLYVNDATVAQSRKSREELLGRTMQECYPGIEATPMFALLTRCLRQGAHESMENDFTFPDGSRICFELRFVPMPDGACILSLDITERRHRLAAIVEGSGDAIIGCAPDGVVTSWNRGAERMFGASAAETVGHPIARFVPPELADEEALRMRAVIEGARLEPIDTSRVRADGARIDVSWAVSPVLGTNGDPNGVSIVARDVSALKSAMRDLASARDALQVANRELEAFSHSVAHDLRGPLRGIDGFSQALVEEYGDRLDDTGRQYLGHVRESAQRMAQLIDDLLSLARVSRAALRHVAVDLSALATSVLERLARVDPTRVVHAHVAPGVVAHGDPKLLEVVITNLLENAWKFTRRRAEAHVEVGCEQGAEGAIYFVRDDGAGFDMAHAGNLFGLFRRLHSIAEFDGTGVGLATVRRIVERHGGRVWAEATPDRGATFRFTLGGGSTRP